VNGESGDVGRSDDAPDRQGGAQRLAPGLEGQRNGAAATPGGLSDSATTVDPRLGRSAPAAGTSTRLASRAG
jgi:hypothetical protein